MRRALATTCLCVAAVGWAAEPVRLVVSLGSNYGAADDVVLQHAEADAARVREVFVELGGVEPGRALVLTRPTATRVREAFAEVTGRIAELTGAGREVQLFVFATSHGRDGALRLTGSTLPIAELKALARGTRASLRVVVVDACEAGVRAKGATKGPAYQLDLGRPETTGDVFISSSGAAEAAQEWEALSGSLFTHHLLAALRGDADANQDGRVTLMEAYGYAERRTVAESLDVGQHPQFDVGLAGSMDVTLTQPGVARAKVVLNEGLEGRFVVVSQPRPDVVLEVQKRRGRPLALAVPAGRYVVRQARGFSVALQEVELPFGGVARVDGRGFVTRDFGEVALKGGVIEFHPHALRVTGGGTSPLMADGPLRWSLGLSYRVAIGTLWGLIGVAWGASRFGGDGLTVFDHRVAARLSAGPRFWLGPVVLMVGGLVEVSWLRQAFVRDREAEIQRSYPALPPRMTVGAALGPQVLAELPLVGPLFVTAGAAGVLRVLPVQGAPLWSPGLDVELGLGARL
ncbi:MAG: hypothetical protein JNJ54_08770 [Myxococcaceae bacterium]|nr:hypothetical protein [Myxococcaceae bacterium]